MQYKEGTKHILNRYIRILGEGMQENLGTYASNLNDPIQEILMVNNTSNNYILILQLIVLLILIHSGSFTQEKQERRQPVISGIRSSQPQM